ncbi:MAG: hypothetical protein IJT96_07720, partial [Lachnospiraceae bacterium]|nr:hypothetical protein [Lachnospiraceae bacterium]
MKKKRLPLIAGIAAVLIIAVSAVFIISHRAKADKKGVSERQIGLGAGYIKAGDRVNLNVFSDEDPWQVMSVSANGEVSDGNMYSK